MSDSGAVRGTGSQRQPVWVRALRSWRHTLVVEGAGVAIFAVLVAGVFPGLW